MKLAFLIAISAITLLCDLSIGNERGKGDKIVYSTAVEDGLLADSSTSLSDHNSLMNTGRNNNQNDILHLAYECFQIQQQCQENTRMLEIQQQCHESVFMNNEQDDSHFIAHEWFERTLEPFVPNFDYESEQPFIADESSPGEYLTTTSNFVIPNGAANSASEENTILPFSHTAIQEEAKTIKFHEFQRSVCIVDIPQLHCDELEEREVISCSTPVEDDRLAISNIPLSDHNSPMGEHHPNHVATDMLETQQECHENVCHEQHDSFCAAQKWFERQQQLEGDVKQCHTDYPLVLNSDFEYEQRVSGDEFYLDDFLQTTSDCVITNGEENSVSTGKTMITMPGNGIEEEAKNTIFNEFQSSGCDFDTFQPQCNEVDKVKILTDISLTSAENCQKNTDTNKEKNDPSVPVLRNRLKSKQKRQRQGRDGIADRSLASIRSVRTVINIFINYRAELELRIEENQPVDRDAILLYMKQIYDGNKDFQMLELLRKISCSEDRLTQGPLETHEEDDFLELAMEYNQMKRSWYKLRTVQLCDYSDSPTTEIIDAAAMATIGLQKHDRLYMQYAEALEEHSRHFGAGIIEVEDQNPDTSDYGGKIQSKADMRKATKLMTEPLKKESQKLRMSSVRNYAKRLQNRETWVPDLIKYTARHLSELPYRHSRSGEFLAFACAYHKHEMEWYEFHASRLEESSDYPDKEDFNTTRYKLVVNRARKFAEDHRLSFREYTKAFDKYLIAVGKPSVTDIPEVSYIGAEEAAILESINHFSMTAAVEKKLLGTSIGYSSVRNAAKSLSSESLKELLNLPLKIIGITDKEFKNNGSVRPFVRLAYHTALYEEAKWRASQQDSIM